MSLDPLFAAGPLVASHALAALLALVLGSFQLALTKGTTLHRASGYVWATALLWVAISSFWIHDIRLWGPFSPIHLLSILVLVTVPLSVWAARRGRLSEHRRGMILLYIFALIGAGIFTLLPGRVMHAVVFGG
ncbi:MAG: DUF2306 domain-containing protein [Pseudomonadota bacterium]